MSHEHHYDSIHPSPFNKKVGDYKGAVRAYLSSPDILKVINRVVSLSKEYFGKTRENKN